MDSLVVWSGVMIACIVVQAGMGTNGELGIFSCVFLPFPVK